MSSMAILDGVEIVFGKPTDLGERKEKRWTTRL